MLLNLLTISITAFPTVKNNPWHRLLALAIASMVFAVFAPTIAPCADVAPWASVLIRLTGGILVTLGVDLIESLHIDNPVGAFAVHGMNGMMGISVGFLDKKAGLFLGGGFDLLGI